MGSWRQRRVKKEVSGGRSEVGEVRQVVLARWSWRRRGLATRREEERKRRCVGATMTAQGVT